MSKSFFFIDDSGGREWSNPYTRDFTSNPPERSDQNLPYWRRNYFVLAGIHISGETIAKLNPYINEQKIKYFGTKHVEIKSEWLRVPHKRRKHYLEPFNITEEALTEFIDQVWYRLLSPDNVTIQAFILDKRYYAKRNRSPLGLLSQVIFDRLVMYPVENAIVVFDQMESSIKSTRHDHGTILRISNQEINISPFFDTYSHSEVRFEQSCHSNFLQLADTVAYNVYRQFVEYGDKWECPGDGDLPMYKYFSKIKDSFYSTANGLVNGFGVVKVPDPAHIRWTQKKTS